MKTVTALVSDDSYLDYTTITVDANNIPVDPWTGEQYRRAGDADPRGWGALDGKKSRWSNGVSTREIIY